MGKRSRRRAREAVHRLHQEHPVSRTQLPVGQRMARVNVEPALWAEFRQASDADGRSVADYLGRLVEKELRRVRRREWRAAASASTPRPKPVAGDLDTEAEVM